MQCLFFIVTACLSARAVLSIKSAERDIWNAVKGNMDTGDVTFLPGEKETINVSVGLTLRTLSNYDDFTSSIKVGYWMNMKWKIPGFTWNPRTYKGVNVIKIPTDAIWVPDIVPYHHTETTNSFPTRVIVGNSGGAIWVPHILSTLICKPIIGGPKYPRDQKICAAKIGSWVYDGFTVNLTNSGSVTSLTEHLDSSSLDSSGWKFVSASVKHMVNHYECCPEPYPALLLSFTIQRADIYFGLALSVPGAVAGLIIALLYLVPPPSAARIISQCICLLVIVFVGVTDIRLMGSTVSMAPAARYFKAAMIIDLFAIFWSILMSVVWMQASGKGDQANGSLDSFLSKMERICCLPSGLVQDDHQHLELDDQSEEKIRKFVAGLSGFQRLALVLDRLLCLGSLVLLIFLFICLGL